MTDVLVRKREKTQRQKCTDGRKPCGKHDAQGEDCVTIKADIGVMELQAKEHQGLLVTTRS